MGLLSLRFWGRGDGPISRSSDWEPFSGLGFCWETAKTIMTDGITKASADLDGEKPGRKVTIDDLRC